MEKPEALTILRRNVINYLNIRTPGHLPCQPDLARSGQVVCFFQVRKPTLTAGFPRMGYTLKALELYATKATRTVLRGRKLPGAFIERKRGLSRKTGTILLS